MNHMILLWLATAYYVNRTGETPWLVGLNVTRNVHACLCARVHECG